MLSAAGAGAGGVAGGGSLGSSTPDLGDSFSKLREEFAKIRAAKDAAKGKAGRGRGKRSSGSPATWGLRRDGETTDGGGWLTGGAGRGKPRHRGQNRGADAAARMRQAVHRAQRVARAGAEASAAAAQASVAGSIAVDLDEEGGSSKRHAPRRGKGSVRRGVRSGARPTLKDVRRRLGPKASRKELQRTLLRETDQWLKKQGLKFRTVRVGEGETPTSLARSMSVKVSWVLAKLKAMGEACGKDTVLDTDIAEIVVQEMGLGVERTDFADPRPTPPPSTEEAEAAGWGLRPPVVTVMGHVDHGKTSLLDCLRGGTTVAEGEAGGITQGISAFTVSLHTASVPLAGREQRTAPTSGKKTKKKKKAATATLRKADSTYSGAVDTVTFIDTPGHALFGAMRAQGSSATDVAVIVVAAEDGVQPQTLESVELCLEAGVPMVVAVTKVDLHPNTTAAVDRIAAQLLEAGVQVEEQGGDTPVVALSSMTGEGVEELKEVLALQAEVMELRAPDAAPGEALVLEASTVRGLGAVADCVVKWGTLKVGDAVVVGHQHARIKALVDTAGKRVKSSGPGSAVRVVGLPEPPGAGHHILAQPTPARAKEVAEWRSKKAEVKRAMEDAAAAAEAAAAASERTEALRAKLKRIEQLSKRDASRRYLTNKGEDIPLHLREQPWEVELRAEVESGGGAAAIEAELGKGRQLEVSSGARGVKQVPALVRVDCAGSLDAVHTVLALMPDDEVAVKVVDGRAHEVTEGDVALAADLEAAVLAFGVRVPAAVERAADKAGVAIITDRVIYGFVDKLAEHLSQFLPADVQERVMGRARVEAVIKLHSTGARKAPSVIAGGTVLEGAISRSGKVRVLRGEEVVYSGPPMASLQSFQNKVERVTKGDECGMGISTTWHDVQEGDIIEVLQHTTSSRRLTVDLEAAGALLARASEEDADP